MIIPLEINNLSLLYLLFSFIIERAISFHSYFHFFRFFRTCVYIRGRHVRAKKKEKTEKITAPQISRKAAKFFKTDSLRLGLSAM